MFQPERYKWNIQYSTMQWLLDISLYKVKWLTDIPYLMCLVFFVTKVNLQCFSGLYPGQFQENMWAPKTRSTQIGTCKIYKIRKQLLSLNKTKVKQLTPCGTCRHYCKGSYHRNGFLLVNLFTPSFNWSH